MKPIRTVVLALALGIPFAGAAWAAPGDDEPRPPADPGTESRDAVSAPPMSPGMEGRTPTDVLRFDALVIEGRIEKPQAVYLLQRTSPSFGDLVPDEPLTPRIFEAVESEPF